MAVEPSGAPSSRFNTTVDLDAPSVRDYEWLVRPMLFAAALVSGLIITFVVGFVFWKAWPLWQREGISFLTQGGWDGQLEDAWTGTAPFFGAAPLLVGTVLTTLGAVLIALVIGLGAAVFLAELAPTWLRRPIETIVQLLAGIPSVVFGLVGLAVLVPFISSSLTPANAGDVVTEIPLDGSCLLAAIIVLSFMILPFFVTVALDSLRSIPRSYMDGGLALGMTRWRTITRIQIPSATPGLIAGIVLAAARAIGEAIALSMVAGAIAFIPTLAHGPGYYFLQPVRTIASAIVDTGVDAANVPSIEAALFALASVLLVFSLALSLGARWAFVLFNRRMNVVTGRRV
jgi:phosphate ABC transporter permease protein PstC